MTISIRFVYLLLIAVVNTFLKPIRINRRKGVNCGPLEKYQGIIFSSLLFKKSFLISFVPII